MTGSQSNLPEGASTLNVRREAGAIGAASTGIGAATTAILASACCASPLLAPLIVGAIGAGGAVWAASLKPYRAYILVASLVPLGFSFWVVHRPAVACAVGEITPGRRWVTRAAKAVTWLGAAFWIAGLTLFLFLP